MRALIGIDGSQGSLAALGFVVRLLAPGKDNLFLYYSPPPVYVRATHDASGTAGELQSQLATAVFEKSRQQLPAAWRESAQSIVGEKPPHEGLLIAADDRRADLIVLGARGAGPQKQPSVGRVARYIVHHATIPVLVVRRATPAARPLHVLLASDGSEISRHASELLCHFSWPAGTTGHAITVAESTAEGRVPEWLVEQLTTEQLAALGIGYFAQDKQEEARLRREVQLWYGTMPAIFNGREPILIAGHACDKVLQAIDDFGIDLVVVGARQQGAVRRLLLGSTSECVLTHAPCSVLVVRGHERP